MFHPPVAVNDLDEVDGEADGKEDGGPDVSTEAETDAVVEEDADEGLHQVVGERHLAHGREISPFRFAVCTMPVETDDGHIGEAHRHYTQRISSGVHEAFRVGNAFAEYLEIKIKYAHGYADEQSPEAKFFQEADVRFQFCEHHVAAHAEAQQEHGQHFRDAVGVQDIAVAIGPARYRPVAPFLPAGVLLVEIHRIAIFIYGNAILLIDCHPEFFQTRAEPDVEQHTNQIDQYRGQDKCDGNRDQGFIAHFPEQWQQHTNQCIEQQDIAFPDQEQVNRTDQQQHKQAPVKNAQRVDALGFVAGEDDGEADTKQE